MAKREDSNKAIVEQLAHIVDDRLHDLVILSVLEDIVEKLSVVEVAEDVVDAAFRLVGQVRTYDLVNRVLTRAQQVAEVFLIVRELDLVERERRLGERVERLPEAVAGAHLVAVQLIVLEQNAYLQYDLDYVVEYGFGLLLRPA